MSALAALALLAAASTPAPIAGHWITVDGKALVEIGPCGAHVCGRILRVLKVDPTKPTTDTNNPDKALRTRPIVGMVFLTGFSPGDDRWRGRIYDPESGRSYRSEVTRTGGVLKVKGCIGPFCRTQAWTAAR